MADTAEPYRTLDPVLVFDHKAELPVQFRESATLYATAPFSVGGLAGLKRRRSFACVVADRDKRAGRLIGYW